MRKTFFGDMVFYQNTGVFERLSVLNTTDLIKIFETIYSLEIALPGFNDDRNLFMTHLNKVLEGTVFSDQRAQIALGIAESFDRLTTFDRTFLLSVMHKPDFFEKHFLIKNREKLDDVITKHGGAILSLAHAGPHIILINLLSKLINGLAITAAGYMPDDFYEAGMGFLRLNGFDNVELLKFSDNFFETCLENLKRNRILILYPEYSRSQQRAGATTSFLGKTVNMPLGSSRLSYHSGKPILPAFIRKVSDYTFELEFGDIILPSADDLLESHSLKTKEVFKFIEEKIIASPQDWEGWQYYEFMAKHVGQDVVERKK
jgi:lauroyl/myristoyl acyltransferase